MLLWFVSSASRQSRKPDDSSGWIQKVCFKSSSAFLRPKLIILYCCIIFANFCSNSGPRPYSKPNTSSSVSPPTVTQTASSTPSKSSSKHSSATSASNAQSKPNPYVSSSSTGNVGGETSMIPMGRSRDDPRLGIGFADHSTSTEPDFFSTSPAFNHFLFIVPRNRMVLLCFSFQRRVICSKSISLKLVRSYRC